MNLKKLYFVLLLLLCLLPISKIKAETNNVGFVQANIWYSQDPFQEGDKIKIYTLVFNPDKRELSGTVIFFDGTTLLGKKDFSVSANGTKEVHIDWTVTVGSHTIFAKIENAKFLISTGKYETISLDNSQTEKSSRTVSKKIIAKNGNLDKDSSSITDIVSSGLIQDIEKIVVNNTPAFISKPINDGTDALEKLRVNLISSSEVKKESLKNEIETLNNKNINDKKTTDNNSIQKPLKQVQLFFTTLLSFIFKNKFLFYGILIALVFLIFRFIWQKIF